MTDAALQQMGEIIISHLYQFIVMSTLSRWELNKVDAHTNSNFYYCWIFKIKTNIFHHLQYTHSILAPKFYFYTTISVVTKFGTQSGTQMCEITQNRLKNWHMRQSTPQWGMYNLVKTY